MRKHGLNLLLVFVLAFQLLLPAFAAENTFSSDAGPSLTTAYYVDGTLYTYVQYQDDSNALEQQVKLMQNDAQIGVQTPAKLEEPAAYMLLIDCSTSMPAYVNQILALAEGLMASGQASVSIASFGEEFSVVQENLTDLAAVQAVINGLSLTQQGTDICGGALKAVEYLKANSWEAGKLTNLILVTDGIPYYAHDEATEQDSEAKAATLLQRELAESPQVLLHSVCFGSWEQDTYAAVSGGIGCQQTSTSTDTAKQAGAEIAAFYESIYGLSYPVEGYEEAYEEGLKLLFQPLTYVPVTAVNLTVDAEEISTAELPTIIGSEGESGPENPAAPEATPVPANPGEAPADPSEGSAEESPAPTSPAVEEPGTAETTAPEETTVFAMGPEESTSDGEVLSSADDEQSETQESGGVPVLLLVVIGCVVLAVLVVLAVVMTKKKQKQEPDQIPNPGTPFAQPEGLRMQLQIVYGNVAAGSPELILSDSLFIGSDSRCGVVLPDVASLAARVFLQNGQVYIEALNENEAVVLKGMRMFAPNPLQSGEQIVIGRNCIALLF